ncbi:MAG: sigma-54-dependent Fis family transcriptional regulator [Myxococcota bacterium]
MDNAGDLEQLRAERDLYRRLLDLGSHDELPAFLDDALGMVVDITGARQGYLELRPKPEAPPVLHVSHACSEEDLRNIRGQLSTGIIAEALKTGRTVSTASALDDPRFKTQQSVQAHRIQAVLCAPIGGSSPLGVLYLQGRTAPGPFPADAQKLLELVALRIAPYVERLLREGRAAATTVDHTAESRARLKAEGLVGRSRALAEAFRQMVVAASVDVTVLLTGESGTGKTEMARAIHQSSRRAAGPFVELNCAAIPETLLEAELFGAEKGAHSTATRRIPGKIAAADGGTLFLDEIGELPLSCQPKLLQFLQSRRYWRLGADVPVEADVRIIAATNVDLAQAVAEKRFREDVFYRLNVLTIRAPSLRERADDIPLLAEHLAAAASASHGRRMTPSWAARSALMHAEWPGNVRQLTSTIQRGVAFALSEGSDVLEVRHLFPDAPATTTPETPTSYQDALRAFQKRFLQEALQACGGNVSETGRRIGLARSHLHELLRAHGLGRGKGA